jgi:hypothetical protein
MAQVSSFFSASKMTAALAYNDEISEETLIIIFNQALYFASHLERVLLNLNQLRIEGLQVDEVPKQLSQGEPLHPVNCPDEDVPMSFIYMVTSR